MNLLFSYAFDTRELYQVIGIANEEDDSPALFRLYFIDENRRVGNLGH